MTLENRFGLGEIERLPWWCLPFFCYTVFIRCTGECRATIRTWQQKCCYYAIRHDLTFTPISSSLVLELDQSRFSTLQYKSAYVVWFIAIAMHIQEGRLDFSWAALAPYDSGSRVYTSKDFPGWGVILGILKLWTSWRIGTGSKTAGEEQNVALMRQRNIWENVLLAPTQHNVGQFIFPDRHCTIAQTFIYKCFQREYKNKHRRIKVLHKTSKASRISGPRKIL